MDKIKKLYQLRENLLVWEKEIGINILSEKSKIIYSYLLTIKKFHFLVRVSKKKYINMIKKKYISCLLNLSQNEIDDGIQEIEKNYKTIIKFKDTLTCIKYTKLY